jgi:outer membrane protein TolC
MVLSGFTIQRLVLHTVLALLFLTSLTVARGQASDVIGTMPEDYLPELKQILATATQRPPSLIESLILIEVREAGRIAANAARLPSLGSNINYGSTELAESGDSSARSRDQGLFYNVGLNQALYHWGALKNQSAIARIHLLLAEKNYARAYRELSVLLRQNYLQLIVTKSRLRHLRESLRLTGVAIDVMKERLARGVAAPSEVAAEELRARELALELKRSEASLLTARAGFSRVAGLAEPLAEDAIPDTIPKPIYSPSLVTALSSALMRDGAKKTLEAEMHELRVREAMLRYRIERVRLLPKFYAGAGYSLENTTTVGTSVGQKAVARQTLSISANWPIFDGFATKAAKMDARASQRAAEARRDAELDALMQEAQALERQLPLDAEQIEVAEIHRGLAQETRRRAAEEVGFGKISAVEIERAQAGVMLAEFKLLDARAALLNRWSQSVAVAGEDPALVNLPAPHARQKK